MPAQAFALALGASIYPPAVAAVIALGRGTEVRPRVLAFVLAALLVTYAVGALLLLVLVGLGATASHNRTPSAAVDLAIGVGLLLLAAWLYYRRPRQDRPGSNGSGAGSADQASAGEPSKLERYLHSRRLAFVLGLTLYVLPSPVYIAAVKTLADANLSTSGELLALAATVAVMLWLIELPMLMLLVAPTRAASTLERLNLWFAAHGRLLAIAISAGAGIYMLARGLEGLLS